jgi:hypothetical protein
MKCRMPLRFLAVFQPRAQSLPNRIPRLRDAAIEQLAEHPTLSAA